MLRSEREKLALLSTTTHYEFGALAAPIAALATSIGASSGVASFVGSIGALAVGVGVSLVAGILLKPEEPTPSNGQIETTQQTPPRTFVYGRMEVSGPLAFKKVRDNTSQLYKIVIISDGEVDAIETLKLDDRICLLNEDNYVKNTFFFNDIERVQILLHSGSDDQPSDTFMMEAFPDVWTVDHRLRGITYAVIICHGIEVDNFTAAYPHGEPIFKAVIRGRRIWDPRDEDQSPDVPSTWLWSDNAALCILDWIAMHPKGYKIARAKLDINSFADMADLCDEIIPLTTGGSEKRYRVATQVNLRDETRTDVLGRLRAACDAHLYKTGSGTWALRGGAWEEPTVTLDTEAGHIIEAEMRDGMDALSRYNELAVTFLSPNNNYAEAECDPWQDVTDPDFIAGRVQTQDLSLTQVPSHAQARRLAKIFTAYDNPDWVGSCRTNFYGLNVIGERNITFNWAEPGETINGAFWLDSDMTMLENGTGMQIGVRSCDSAAYDWDFETEEGTPPSILPPEDIEFTPGIPPDNPVDFEVIGNVRGSLATWTAPEDPFYIARLWRSPEGASFDDAIEVSGPRYIPEHPEIDRTMTHYDPTPAGTYDYWLTVENPIGERNTPLGPVTATATSAGDFFAIDDYGNRLTDDAGDYILIEV